MDDDATDEALSAADTAAQEAEDQLEMGKEIEANHRAWLKAIVPIFGVLETDLSGFDPDVRGEVERTVIAACQRARRELESDLP